MDNTEVSSKTGLNKIVTYTKYVLVIVTLLTAIPLLHHWFYNGYKIVGLWSIVLAAILFFKNNKYFRKKEYIVLFLFCISYFVTIILNERGHFVNEILILSYLVMSFFVLTYCDKSLTKDDVRQEIKNISWILIITTMIYSVINFIMYVAALLLNTNLAYGKYIYGMVEGQLGGIYNPNTGASLNYISAIISIVMIRKLKKRKKLLIFNVIIQAICFSLVQSRGSWICLLGFIILYSIFVWKDRKIWIRIFTGILVCVLLCGASSAGRHVFSKALVSLSELEVLKESEAEKIVTERKEKEEKTAEEFSTGRSGLWKVGLNAYKKEKVLGIGYRSIDDVFQEELSEFVYQNSASGGLHNVYITVLVASGFAGFIFFACYCLLILIRALKILFGKNEKEYQKCIAIFIVIWFVGELVESRIMFVPSIFSTLFWLLSGYVMYFTRGEEGHGKCNCSNL